MRLALVLLGLALVACDGKPNKRHAKVVEELPASPREFAFEVDLERVRALGWAASDATDADALQAAKAILERRLPFGTDARARVLPDERGIQVQFVSLTDPQAERVSGSIAGLGALEFRIVADGQTFAALGLDRDVETRKLEAWRAANPDAPLVAFGLLAADQGGPDPRIGWLPRRSIAGDVEPVAVLVPESFESCFGAGHLERVFPTADPAGLPALGFEFAPGARAGFADFTEANIDRSLGVAIEDVLVSAPIIAARLPWAGVVSANWEDVAEVEALAAELHPDAGPLRRVR